MRLLFLLVSLCLCGCNSPYRGYDVLGPDEFVLDSYRIREGKNAILEMAGTPLLALDPELLEPYEDRLRDGDLLSIRLYQAGLGSHASLHPPLNTTLDCTVDQGQIVLPDLGVISVGNLTLEEAQKKLEKEYLDQIGAVQVFLNFRDRGQTRVEFIGLVQATSLPVYGHTRLYDVLATAKVVHRANFYASYVLRDGHPLPIDLHRLLIEGDLSQNIVLRGGDKIFIADPAESRVMVMGEVAHQKAVSMTKPYINLREALAEAGGIPFTGDRRFIQVIRGNVLKPRIYTLNWLHVIHLPNDSLLLMPGDVVYVAATPITEWSRFINQLLPSFFIIGEASRGGAFVGL